MVSAVFCQIHYVDYNAVRAWFGPPDLRRFPGFAAALDQVAGVVAGEPSIAVDNDFLVAVAVAEFDALGEFDYVIHDCLPED